MTGTMTSRFTLGICNMAQSKPPKWVYCPVCGDRLYGGPSFQQIPRECECGATVVVPKEDRGYVKWDDKRYAEWLNSLPESVRDTVPHEPVVEYVEEGEVLEVQVPVAPPVTIDDVYKAHMKKIEGGEPV